MGGYHAIPKIPSGTCPPKPNLSTPRTETCALFGGGRYDVVCGCVCVRGGVFDEVYPLKDQLYCKIYSSVYAHYHDCK